MIERVIFSANNNQYAEVVTDVEIDQTLQSYLFADNNSPLLKKDVKIIYPPKDLNIKSCIIRERFIQEKCLFCEGKNCAAVKTDTYIDSKNVIVIHCSTYKNFFYLKNEYK